VTVELGFEIVGGSRLLSAIEVGGQWFDRRWAGTEGMTYREEGP
jgi:hypothetical protein